MASCLAALSLTAGASPATAAQTIGQIAPTTPPIDCAGAVFDFVQPTVTAGTPYVVPAVPPAEELVISSWSTRAATGANQMAMMKVFRKVANPATYMAVGHDGPQPLTPSSVNTFETNIPVEPGDVLGLTNSVPSSFACGFPVPGETRLVRPGNLADGQSGAFGSQADRRTNVSAVVSPSNELTLGEITRKKRKGTATIAVEVPNPGDLTLSGEGIKPTEAVASKAATTGGTGASEVTLPIKATGKKKRKLKKKGKVKVSPEITYTPTAGESNSESTTLKLKRKRR